MKLPAPIMTDEELEQAEEESLELEREFLDRQQKPKQERTRTVDRHMLRTPEAAQYIGVSEWQLRQMFYSGEIPAIRRKYFLFSVNDLDKWIAKERSTS